MKLSWTVYIASLFVLILSFVAVIFLPVSDLYRGIIAIPGVSSLIAALYQIFRDKAAYDKNISLQNKQNIFNLSVTSHMANVAFDKHVEFCEKYIEKMNECIQLVFKEGPSDHTRSFAQELRKIRHRYSAWITEDTTSKLVQLENALHIVGTAFNEIKVTEENNKAKLELTNSMHETITKALGSTFDISQLDKDVLASTVVNHLQNILGISELTTLRQSYLSTAIGSIACTPYKEIQSIRKNSRQ
jgi:hypothetical protein